jgi:D-alanyl-D-alanine carboxypeptidase/D-alanyl-D-alanine-endopeptidase (penicillin-binding protein 4)
LTGAQASLLRAGVLFFSILMVCAGSARADIILDSRLAQLLPRKAVWGLVAIDLQTGRQLLSSGTAVDTPLVPASLVKLFVSGAALDRVERNGALDMSTKLLSDGEFRDGMLQGNLYLVGRGNAFLAGSDLAQMVQVLVQQGLRRVNGDIRADDTIFDTAGLQRNRRGAGYAPAGALGLDLHTVVVTVTPTGPGSPPTVTVEPPNDAVRMAVAARSAATGSAPLEVVRLDDCSYKITGNILLDAGSRQWRFPLDDPALYAAGVLKTLLKRSGIEVSGNPGKGRAPADAAILTATAGPEIDRFIREMNVNSLNIAADNLMLLLAESGRGRPGTVKNGREVITDFLGSSGFPHGNVTITDGSGLREDNRVSAGFMAEYLRAVSRRGWFTRFRDSLPKAGMEGTTRSVLHEDARFRVKTGRLERSFSLAGYGSDRNGRPISFAYIVNLPEGMLINLDRCGDEVMKYLGTEALQ